jgi:hypothetical protein
LSHAPAFSPTVAHSCAGSPEQHPSVKPSTALIASCPVALVSEEAVTVALGATFEPTGGCDSSVYGSTVYCLCQ